MPVYRYGNNYVHTDASGKPTGATDLFGRQINIPAGFSVNGKAVTEVLWGWPDPVDNGTGLSGFENAPPLRTDAERAAQTLEGNPVGRGYANAGYGQGTGLAGGSQSGAGSQTPVPGSGGGPQVPVPGEESSGGGPSPYQYGFRHGSQPLPGNVLNLDPENLLQIMFGGGDTLTRRPPRLGSPYRDNISQQAQRLVSSPGLFNSQGDSTANFAFRNAGANAFGIQRQQAQGQISKQRGNLFFGTVNDLRRNDDINRNDLMEMLLRYKTGQQNLEQQDEHFDQSLEQRASEFNRNMEFNVQTERGNRKDSRTDAWLGLAAALLPWGINALLRPKNTGTVRGGGYQTGTNYGGMNSGGINLPGTDFGWGG